MTYLSFFGMSTLVIGPAADPPDDAPLLPAPVIEPAPLDIEPAPLAAEPAPLDIEPAPLDIEPAPLEAEPAPLDMVPPDIALDIPLLPAAAAELVTLLPPAAAPVLPAAGEDPELPVLAEPHPAMARTAARPTAPITAIRLLYIATPLL